MNTTKQPELKIDAVDQVEVKQEETVKLQPKKRTCFSSTEFPALWQYSIAQDFHSDTNEPAQYVDGHPQHWNANEEAKLSLGRTVNTMAVNSDSSLFALAVGNEVQIYSAGNQELVRCITGHVSPVVAIVWHPLEPQKLVSHSKKEPSRRRPLDEEDKPSEFIFWDLNNTALGSPSNDILLENLAESAVDTIKSGITDTIAEQFNSWSLSPLEQSALTKTIAATLKRSSVKSLTRESERVHGRLISSFGSKSFSSDGQSLIYLPGERLESNSDVPWDIHVLDVASKQVRVKLTGHTDAIMWAGFNNDNTLLGSACWDGTFRIWSAVTGGVRHVFESPERCQNWTAGFSPDGKLFAGTLGLGRFKVWELSTGSEIASHEFGKGRAWPRTLDWSTDSRYLAVGGGAQCTIIVVEPRSPPDKQMLQHRRLSTDACDVDEDMKYAMGSFLETTSLMYLPGGRKIAYKMSSDRGVEIYDFVSNEKWRFAATEVEDEEDNGWGPLVFMPAQGLLASVDGNSVRFWKVKPSEGDQW